MTEKLYYIDSHIREFTAVVQSCEKGKHGYDVILDRTAFYPEGGGQPGDRGTLNGIAVTDTHETGGNVVHYCESPLPVGETVTGILDWDWRFQLMQQHSGEHMVSGLVNAAYGYHNVGFHMGKDAVTIDFDGMLTEEQLAEIEAKVNAAIWQDSPVEILWPDAETLKELPYRSKKELTGDVRIVRFPDADCCACCGTHVLRAGQVGLVKVLSCQKFRDGVRMEILCGNRALEFFNTVYDQNRAVAQALSVKMHATAAAVERLQAELADVKHQAALLETQLFAQTAAAYTGAGDVLMFQPPMQPASVRRLCDAVAKECGGLCAVFAGESSQYNYALGRADGADISAMVKAMNAALKGRGGGRNGFAQGTAAASQTEIEAFFKTL